MNYKLIIVGLTFLGYGFFGVTHIYCEDYLKYTNYLFSDNLKNQVSTSAFSLAKEVVEKTVFLLDIELDQVSVPAIKKIDGVSSASRPSRRGNDEFVKNRGQVIAGLERAVSDDFSVSGSYYNSQELDYTSQALIATLRRELYQKNLTLFLKGQYTRDQVGELTPDNALIFRWKGIYTGAFSATQLVSPTSFVTLSVDGVRMEGFLSDPYRNVRLGVGLGELEVHPGVRNRAAVQVKYSKFLPPIKASIITSGRYYADDWKVSSQTVHLKINKYIFDDVILSAEYRFYNQLGAEFYKETYAGSEIYKTADYKLSPFNSNNAGASLTWFPKKLAKEKPQFSFLEKSSIAFMYFKYFNNLDFSADIIQGNINFAL